MTYVATSLERPVNLYRKKYNCAIDEMMSERHFSLRIVNDALISECESLSYATLSPCIVKVKFTGD